MSATVRGQTLARPGWVGSGLTYQSWSKHAVIYEIDTRSFEDTDGDGVGDLKGITKRLDYIKSLGVDAILLEPLAVAQSGSPVPIDPALGTLEDFDELSVEASRHNLRILLDLPAPDVSLARFWLTRGVAGFHVPGSVSAPAVQPIRKLLPTFVGQRILITDADPGAAAVKLAANELVLDQAIVKIPSKAGANRASELRSALDQSQTLQRSGGTVVETDALGVARSNDRFGGSANPKDAAKALGAALLLNRSIALIYAGQEIGLSSSDGAPVMMPWGKAPVALSEDMAPAPPKPAPPPPPPPDKFEVPDRYVPYVPPPKPVAPPKPLPPDPTTAAGQDVLQDSPLNFYRELIRLHHGTTALRDGEQIMLNHDDTNALIFVRRPPIPSLQTPAIFVVCNLSAKPLGLSLKPDVANLRLRGSFLRKLLRSDAEEGAMYVDSVTLPGFGVYVGELRY